MEHNGAATERKTVSHNTTHPTLTEEAVKSASGDEHALLRPGPHRTEREMSWRPLNAYKRAMRSAARMEGL